MKKFFKTAMVCALLMLAVSVFAFAAQPAHGSYIGQEKAVQIAIEYLGGNATVVEVEQELNKRVPKYEIKLIDADYKYEVEVHAQTGEVIDFEKKKLKIKNVN